MSGEFAWGTSLVTGNEYTLSNPGQTGEIIDNPAVNPGEGNAGYSITTTLVGSPFRNGIFATASSNRVSSGGSFYGVMELSGNLWERVVTTANSAGRRNYGSGIALQGLSPDGHSMEFGPGFNFITGQVDGQVNALGLMYRGGAWNSPSTEMQVSSRSGANVISTPDNLRFGQNGGRGVKN